MLIFIYLFHIHFFFCFPTFVYKVIMKYFFFVLYINFKLSKNLKAINIIFPKKKKIRTEHSKYHNIERFPLLFLTSVARKSAISNCIGKK